MMKKPNTQENNDFEKAFRSMPLRTYRLDEQASRDLWRDITRQMDAQSAPRLPKRRWPGRAVGLVAGLALLIGAALLLTDLWQSSAITEIHTAYGDTRAVALPDGSQVLLHGNSRLSYASDWEDGPREVRFEGDGRFTVVRSPQTFTVRMKEASVEVLGTVFDVHDRAGKTQVHLSEGSVRFSTTSQPAHQHLMSVGEVVSYGHGGDTVVKKPLKNTSFIGWGDDGKEIRFYNTSLEEVIGFIEAVYGYGIVLGEALPDGYIARERIYGGARVDRPHVTVKRLAAVFGLKADYNQKKNEWTLHR